MQKVKTNEERKKEVKELSQLIKEIVARKGVLVLDYYDLMTISPSDLRKRVYGPEGCP